MAVSAGAQSRADASFQTDHSSSQSKVGCARSTGQPSDGIKRLDTTEHGKTNDANWSDGERSAGSETGLLEGTQVPSEDFLAPSGGFLEQSDYEMWALSEEQETEGF